MIHLAHNIKTLRLHHNLSQAKLAQKLQISNLPAIRAWEKQRSYPSLLNILKLCHLFKTDPTSLIHKKISKKNPYPLKIQPSAKINKAGDILFYPNLPTKTPKQIKYFKKTVNSLNKQFNNIKSP